MPARRSVSGALRAGGAPRLGQSFEVVAAGRDGDVSIFKGEIVGVEPVYQHNQTDLEFLRVRAARRGDEADAPPAAVPPSPCLPAEMIRLLGFPLRPAATFEGPSLRIRGSIELAGVGAPFNGKYLVTGVSHRIGRRPQRRRAVLASRGRRRGAGRLRRRRSRPAGHPRLALEPRSLRG